MTSFAARALTRALLRPLAIAVAVALPGSAVAQTDYYNTDAGRPLTIEDAHALERYGFELQLAPLRLQRAARGIYHLTLEPEIAYGILPRTQLEVGIPLAWIDRGIAGDRSMGVAGIDIGILHSLNVETRTLPAMAIAAELLAPVGSLGPDEARASVKGIVTRTWSWARVHVNGAYTFGSDIASEGNGVVDLSRWEAGASIDRVFPLRSALIGAEFVAEQPLHDDEDVSFKVGVGTRYQWSPRLAVDAGVGRRVGSGDPGWYVTFGSAYAFGVRSLIPVR